LVARSQCHLKLGDAASALKDAEASFDAKETYIMGLFQFAEALFNLGQFEQALIAYHRGFRARRDKEEFRIGINKAQDAIRRAIGGLTFYIQIPIEPGN
jgi:tetratricopeptide (TPR) repeat protein